MKQRNIILTIAVICICTKITGQTSGPSQPEVQSFQAVSITNMVETSTGQFQYNISLFSIGGYPVNVNYNSRITMDQEASMVGLGWNLNCGAIIRQVRGIPDDFNGDSYVKRVNMKDNITKGVNLGIAFEVVGFDKDKATSNLGLNLNYSTGLFWNSYTGFGLERSLGAGLHANGGGVSGNAGLGITSNSNNGTSVSPYFGLSYQYTKNETEKNKNATFKDMKKKTLAVKPLAIKNSYGGTFGSYNFNSTSFNPKIDFPFTTVTKDFNIKAGFAGAYTEIGGNIKGYIMKQKLESNVLTNPAYGYLYAHNARYKLDALMDFNRENDGIVTEDKPNLPLAYGTPDIYSVSGQGVGGTFELRRNNIFIGYDPIMSSRSYSPGLEVEFGAGTGIHVGADLRFGYIKNSSLKWNDANNELLPFVDFSSVLNGSNSHFAEQVYFKNPNDVMFNSNPIYNLTDQSPFAPKLKTSVVFGGSVKPNVLNIGNINTSFNTSTTSFANKSRDFRTDVIYYLNAEEASTFGIEKDVKSYSLNIFNTAPTSLPRVGDGRAIEHLSEMICLKPSGEKYVFNVPAYNKEQREVSYSINEGTDVTDYVANFDPDVTTPSNQFKGIDEFVSVNEVPAYAHSFLLGAVLSSNYIDVDDNGPSINDFGDYTKFNYSRVYTDFYWRSNNEVGKGTADLGKMAVKNDGKAMYNEGTKEIWYLHSIESKNEVAHFYYSDRADAFDLKSPSKKLKRLDSILIYSRPMLGGSNPVPMKRIYFDFAPVANSLCIDVLNQPNVGKLTLNKVYFKDGSSDKGKHSPYVFGYSANNPKYNKDAYDRWGNYKPDATVQSDLKLDNKLFPYVNQNKLAADANANAWLLNSIELPSGGKINVDYEAHDYSYVQHKKAMMMTKVIGFTDVKPTTLSQAKSNLLYNPSSGSGSGVGGTVSKYIIIKLQTPINGALTPADADFKVREDYFTDYGDVQYGHIIGSGPSHAGNLYGKFRVKLDPSGGYTEEDIPVFLDAGECGALKFGSTNYNYAYVKLKDENVKTAFNVVPVNQVTKAAFGYVKNNYPGILFGMDNTPGISTEEGAEAIVDALFPVFGIVKSIQESHPDKVLLDKFVATTFDTSCSYIRVYKPDGIKFGGNGARVKKVTIDDNWNNMSGIAATNASYSIHYKYTKKEGNKIISSGVASYEPEVGGEENPWKQPIFYYSKNVLMPDDNLFMMTPYGESLFPGSEIIYSEVKTIQNPVNNTTTQRGTGYSVNKYYTYRDFPCKVFQTDIEIQRKPKWQLSLIKNLSNDWMLGAQGYSVITNDMHGKPLSEEVFGDSGNLITGQYYKYLQNDKGELKNSVNAASKNGRITGLELGIETQTYGDARCFETESYSGDVHGNLEFQMVGPAPTIVPSFWPDFAYEHKQFASFTFTKHVRVQGILDSVIAIDKGSRIFTKNLLWDSMTGAVLLTQSMNEFKDPIYNFTYPAHWAYNGMGLASQNISAEFTSLPSNFFVAGDIIADKTTGTKFIAMNGTGGFQPYYNGGSAYSSSNIKKIICSGRKNLATTPIGSLTSLKNPIQNMSWGKWLIINTGIEIINSEAVEYFNYNKAPCGACFSEQLNMSNNPTAPYTFLAPWTQKATYKFIGNRIQSSINPNLRKDGYLMGWVPYWNMSFPTGFMSNTTSGVWQFTEKVSKMSNWMQPIETVNPLGIYSNLQMSNFHGLVNATSSNSRAFEILFESFEDVIDSCKQKHFSVLKNRNSMLVNTVSHSGFYSLRTGSNPYIIKFGDNLNSSNFNSTYNNYQDCEDYCLCKNITNISQLMAINSDAKYEKCKSFISRFGNVSSSNNISYNINCPQTSDCKLDTTNCITSSYLLPNKKYIISAWVKPVIADNITLSYSSVNIGLKNGGTTFASASPNGQIIDGWQRIHYEFTTPNSTTFAGNFAFSLSPNCYFDDIRIFPADANMKSYVYNYKNYSLMAILDENNFATFYEYDQQNQLQRVKKETQKGIATIQEINFGSFKR